MNKKLTVQFTSHWQVSSGLGDGSWADSMLVRSHDALLYIPGRAIKGALREAAQKLSLCGREDLKQAVELFFGSASQAAGATADGLITVSSCYLPEDLRQMLLAFDDGVDRENAVRDLTVRRIMTSLDNRRQVKTGSLRTIEVGIPGVNFEGEISYEIPEGYTKQWCDDYFACVCAAVKSIGGDRARGMGCCHVFLDGKQQQVKLPEMRDPACQK